MRFAWGAIRARLDAEPEKAPGRREIELGDPALATVNRFSFLGVHLRNVTFLVADQSGRARSVGTLGQNLLHFSDVEYDFANGTIVFIRPVGCGAQPLA